MMLTEGEVVAVWVQGFKQVIILRNCIDPRVGVERDGAGDGAWDCYKRSSVSGEERRSYQRGRMNGGGDGGALGVGWGRGVTRIDPEIRTEERERSRRLCFSWRYVYAWVCDVHGCFSMGEE